MCWARCGALVKCQVALWKGGQCSLPSPSLEAPCPTHPPLCFAVKGVKGGSASAVPLVSHICLDNTHSAPLPLCAPAAEGVKVGGASAGSLIAAVLQSGMPLDFVTEQCMRFMADLRDNGARGRMGVRPALGL